MDEPMTTDACTLPTAERPLRRAEFDALFSESVRTAERGDDRVVLHLSGTAGLQDRVRDLTERESACCSFFRFEIEGVDDDLTLRISVPPEHLDILAAITERATGQSA
jgi:hypothetical protein